MNYTNSSAVNREVSVAAQNDSQIVRITRKAWSAERWVYFTIACIIAATFILCECGLVKEY